MNSTAQNQATSTASAGNSAGIRWHQAVAGSRHTIALDERDPSARSCAPWCTEADDDQGGHPPVADPDDRRCSSAPAAVTLAHHRGAFSLEPGAGICPAVAEVALTQRHDAAEPELELTAHSWSFVPGAGDVAVGTDPLRLTPAEARALAELLVLAADTAAAGGVR